MLGFWRSTACATLRRSALVAVLSLVATAVMLGTAHPASASGAGAATPAASKGISITFGGCTGGGTQYCFAPEKTSTALNTMVVWTNTSGAPHTLAPCNATACPGAPSTTGSNSFNVPISSSNGSTGSFTFTSAGRYVYYCTIHGYAAMHATITILAPPTITSISPTSGPPGTSVTITGAHLAKATKVTFNGVAAMIVSDTATQIVATVPATATTGKVAVTTAAGTAMSAQTFTVT